MSDGVARIRLKLNELEIECEGRESFLVSDLPDLLSRVSKELEGYQGTALAPTRAPAPEGDGSAAEDSAAFVRERPSAVTTNTIATRMGAKKASDLLRAASVHLIVVDGRETFSRQELLEEAKTAKSHYKVTVSKNLTATIKGLIERNVLNETAPGTYTLTPGEEERMRKFLRDAQLL